MTGSPPTSGSGETCATDADRSATATTGLVAEAVSLAGFRSRLLVATEAEPVSQESVAAPEATRTVTAIDAVSPGASASSEHVSSVHVNPGAEIDRSSVPAGMAV